MVWCDKRRKTRRCSQSSIFFYIYLDGLLRTMSSCKIGCFIGTMFIGILTYADDFALLAPTLQAMRRMLSICKKYSAEFDMVFNASKSKCIICAPRSIKTVIFLNLQLVAITLNLCKVGSILDILFPVTWTMKTILQVPTSFDW